VIIGNTEMLRLLPELSLQVEGQQCNVPVFDPTFFQIFY
jgi:hypothetical protein